LSYAICSLTIVGGSVADEFRIAYKGCDGGY
jgi:hypothetical protein